MKAIVKMQLEGTPMIALYKSYATTMLRDSPRSRVKLFVIAHKKLQLDGYTRQLHTQNRKGDPV